MEHQKGIMQHQNFITAFNNPTTNERVEIKSTAKLVGNKFEVVIDSSEGHHINVRTYEIDSTRELQKVKEQIKNINYLNENDLKTVEVYLNSFGNIVSTHDKNTASDIIKTIFLNTTSEVKNIIIGAIGSSVQANTDTINDIVKSIIQFFTK